jgi:hypothetical protein
MEAYSRKTEVEKYAFLLTANALHFSIMNRLYLYFFNKGVIGQ